jgi:hypothetical protein
MNITSNLKRGLIAVAVAGTTLALGACADDGYGRNYSSFSLGVSSSDYDRGYGGRGYRDRDGDGVPNRYDRRPSNPYRN